MVDLKRCNGLTLVELSIVLVIVGVLMQAAIAPLSGSQELQRYREVTKELEIIKQAVISHLLLYGTLPCPLTSTALDEECTARDGQLSAVALGLSGDINDSDAMLDPWGNPYRFVIGAQSPDWLLPHHFLQVPISDWRATIELCKRAQSSGCSRRNLRADNIVFVVYSLGADSSSVGDQAENLDGDFVFSVRSESLQADEKYDDHVIWATQNELLSWLLRSGVLL